MLVVRLIGFKDLGNYSSCNRYCLVPRGVSRVSRDVETVYLQTLLLFFIIIGILILLTRESN